MGQQAQPLAQQGIDLLRREAVADLLQAFRVGAAQDAVVERLERNALPGELAFGVFVAVQAQLGIERKVAAELEEERPEIAVERVDVIVIDHRGRTHDPGVRTPGRRALALLGAEHRRLLLRLADKDHAFLALEFAQMLCHHVVFALAFAKLDQRDLMLRRVAFQLGNEVPAHRAHHRGGWHRQSTMLAEKPHYSLFMLQLGHVDVEVHPVDPLDRQFNVMAEDIGHALCYHRKGSGRSVLPLEGV